MKSAATQQGASLLEVLIAVTILSIGLLGLAGMQLNAMQDTQSAFQRSLITMLVADIADRMRANPQGLEDGAYDDITVIPSDPGCIDTGCTPAEMAQYDAFAWGGTLAQALPSGQGRVTAAGSGQFTVTVMWDEARTGATGTGCDPADEEDLKCFSVVLRP